jgi:hypothetical protein
MLTTLESESFGNRIEPNSCAGMAEDDQHTASHARKSQWQENGVGKVLTLYSTRITAAQAVTHFSETVAHF